MKRIYRVIDRVFHHVTKKDWDACYGIVGDEGKSKSTLGLHIIDRWYSNLKGQVTAEDVSHMCLDKLEFAEDLKNLDRFEAVDFDETDLSNKRTMSSYNYLISGTFQIIRGDNLFVLLTLPSIFDIDGFFSKRRMKGLFVVYARGKVAFYNQTKLRQIIAYNQNRLVKSTQVVTPCFYDTFPKYKGELLQPYLDKKYDRMKQKRIELYNTLANEIEFDKIDKVIENLTDKGHTQKEISQICGMTQQGVSYRLNKIQKTKVYTDSG